VDGLLFQVADPRALARAMRRACTEEGLWERLVAGLPQAPAREVMVDGFIATYQPEVACQPYTDSRLNPALVTTA
jgi:hypothetical protein